MPVITGICCFEGPGFGLIFDIWKMHSPLKYFSMIRKLKSGQYRIYSRKINPQTGKRRNLGTFDSIEAAKKHEREIQYFKHHWFGSNGYFGNSLW